MVKLSALVVISALASSVQAALPFIADDYPKARAEASRRNLPIFVDVWAPW